MISPNQRTVLSWPLFTDKFTSALSRQPGVQGVGDVVYGDWRDWAVRLAPAAQQVLAATLRSAGVPDSLVSGGMAVAYAAQGYKFGGGTLRLRSGASGTPMTDPQGRRLLLLSDGGTVPYSDSDLATVTVEGRTSTGGGDNTMLYVVAALAAVLILKR